MDNADVARVLEEVADLLELEGENPFRVRAYRTAARTVGTLGEPLDAIVARGGARALAELPGIGKDLAGKIAGLLETGELPLLRELAAKVPEGVARMMRIGGVGPKRAMLLHGELGVSTLDELEAAARDGRLRRVRGFGEALEAKILKGCAEARARSGRVRLAEAESHARPLVERLRSAPEAEAVEVAGSYRRRKETVGDLDLLVASRDPAAIAALLLGYPDVKRVLAHGETKCSVVLRSGLQVDLRIVEPESFGAALHYFTGSKAHNIAVRTLGVKRRLKINEYGVFRGDQRIGGRTEEQVFRAVGLPWIPPELREADGEIEAARERRLPRLVELGDLRGDLQMHTTWSDGADTLEDMVEACRDRGHEYVAITDHTKALSMIRGLDRAKLRRQAAAVRAVRERVRGITVLHGAEVDILEDGGLDLDDEALAELDIVLAAVHTRLDLPEARMTERVLSAMRNPRVSVLAHPTARRIGLREPIAVDMGQVVRSAAERGVLLEINGQPERLDLKDVHVRMAREAGARLVISTDAHRVAELDYLRFGVDQARRGWCTREDVANAWPLEELLRVLASRRAGPGAAAPVVASGPWRG